ncbi:MAG TPA: response regulator [Phycisphaerales bacterium]|nr:response regulator [Phycisphaerales bacterium]
MSKDKLIAELRAQLKAAQEEARATQEMFQLAIDSIPSCIFWKDKNGTYLGVNRLLAEASGCSHTSELIGGNDYDFWAAEDAAKYQADDKRIMESGVAEYGLIEQQIRDGKVHYLETNKAPLRNAQGEVVAVLGTFQDVTERLELQEEVRRHRDELEQLVEERTKELQEANDALVEAEKAKSEFFANISHELRTPLTLILAPLESALDGSYGELEPSLKKSLETVHRSGVRLLDLVSSILDVSKLEAGHMKAKRQACHPDVLMKNIVADFTPLALKNSQKLQCDIRETGTRLLDPYLLERIIFNLVSNALKFTPEEGTVEVKSWNDGDLLFFEVRDTGIGIPEEAQANLFRKFYQVESSSTRRYEGTGLGLAMVKDFAQLMGGDVKLQSVPGQGSTFTVTLAAPECEIDTGVAPEGTVTRRATAPENYYLDLTQNDQGPVILIAEDNIELARYIAEVLDPLGRVSWAPNGKVALEMARELQPELILSDVMMPERDGIWLCQKIQEEFRDEGPSIVLLTALSDRESLLRGWEAGAADFLRKPFHPLELTTRIQALIKARRERVKAAEERRLLEARLFESQRLDSLGIMAGGIAHDFNNLLAIVSGELELAMLEQLKPTTQECLREAELAVRQASGLSQQMLAYVGQIPQTKSVVDLAEMAEETARIVGRGLIPKPLFEFDLAGAPIEADRNQMCQVALNLITNGAEAVPQGTRPVIKISTGVREFSAEFLGRESAQTCSFLRVEDNGAGMDEETLKRVFDPFFTTKFTGRGLGLAAVYGITTSHSGICKIDSKPGQGSTFWILFPPTALESKVEAAPESIEGAGHGTILVVDDVAQMRSTVGKMLVKWGFKVVEAESGREAMEKVRLEAGNIRAALVDVILPDTNGYQLASTLQNIDPGLQFLMFSGYRGESIEIGPFKFLPKPFKLEDLRHDLFHLLDTDKSHSKT